MKIRSNLQETLTDQSTIIRGYFTVFECSVIPGTDTRVHFFQLSIDQPVIY